MTTPEGIKLTQPWNDNTIVLNVTEQDQALIDALNDLHLPPRFSAIWHRKSKDLEFIYISYPFKLRVSGRRFTTYFKGKDYICEYAEASQELVAIANSTKITDQPTETDYRNLQAFALGLQYRKDNPNQTEVMETIPISFWIRNIEWDEDYVTDFARHLNFYMNLYDRQSPLIRIHEDQSELRKPPIPVSEPFGSFPNAIIGNTIDLNLLRIWESIVFNDPFKRFIYSYQILEYSAFYYINDDMKRAIRKILLSPDALTRVDEVVARVQEALTEGRGTDEKRINQIIKQCAEDKSIWQEISHYENVFTKEIMFEGGFKVTAPLSSWKDTAFREAWPEKFQDTFHKMRNVIVHARESRNPNSISPTEANAFLLAPWSDLMAAVARQVIINRDF